MSSFDYELTHGGMRNPSFMCYPSEGVALWEVYAGPLSVLISKGIPQTAKLLVK